MSARVINMAQRARGTPAPIDSPSRRRIPAATCLDIDLVAMMEDTNLGTTGSRMSVVVNADNTWTVTVVRATDHKCLLVHGNAESSAPALMREVIGWLFGMTACVAVLAACGMP